MRASRTAGSIALAFVDAVLIAVSLSAAGFCVYTILAHKPHLWLRLTPGVTAVVAPLVALRLNPAIRAITASVFIGAGAGVYAAQLAAFVLADPDRPPAQQMEDAAKQDGLAFDRRTRLEVILSLRKRAIQAYPPFYPTNTLESPLRIAGQSVVPLGSISHAFTVCCNEGGPYLTYTTDEHGFPNPPGAWSRSPIELAVIGSSQVVSESVPQEDGIPALLRARYPDVVVVAAGGDGPLFELAGLREYLAALKPKRVIWAFAESHSPDFLNRESQSALLMQYLDPSFREGLIGRQDEINAAESGYFEDGLRTEMEAESWAAAARQWASLKSIRTLLYSYLDARTADPNARPFASELYERILQQGRDEIAGWGGALTLVYWPDSSRYAGICRYSPALRSYYDRLHDTVCGIAQKLSIPVIDVSRAFPDLPASESPKNAVYFYPYPAHFRPAGYRRAADAILSALGAAR